MNIKVPELSLVVLIGASGSGKSTLARKLFKPTEILSSDTCRGWVSDDENSQEATNDAFDVLHYVAAKRLARGMLTVVDATNVRSEDRRPFVELAREFHCLPVAVVLDIPERICHDRNVTRADRAFGSHVIRNQRTAMRKEIRNLQREGFRHIFTFRSPEEVQAASLEREPLWNNLKQERGPFDIIGDVHGCFDELIELLENLGYSITKAPDVPEGDWSVTPPPGRKAVFVGDLVDRGPKVVSVLRLVMSMVAERTALCVPGNHDAKLFRALSGKQVQVTHGLDISLAQLNAESPEFRAKVAAFLDELISHYVLDDGKLVVAHAGMKESMQGRGSGKVREFALYGETTGETDEFGLPIRYNWAGEYRGRAAVVYGHTPVPEAEWLNNTICIDTGCVFGGKLTALRYPERTLLSVPARATYAISKKPFLDQSLQAPLSLQHQHDDLLDFDDVSGKRAIETRLQRMITIRAENAAAAIEVMSRFAADPRWLIYLPPTMSPSETTSEPGMLEHPREAFNYFRTNGVAQVICEEKHMGSRAVVVVCRDEDAAKKRFGAPGVGICYTRTGRRFFDDAALERLLLDRVRAAASASGLWEELSTDWLCLDCELMPWSAKAQGLIREQYARVGAAATAGVGALDAAIAQLSSRGISPGEHLASFFARKDLVDKYVAAYRRYCWPVQSIDDLRLAPFHLLASEGHVHFDKDHRWHMETLAKLAAHDPILTATKTRFADLADESSERDAIQWWLDLTASGGEGMVIKPLDFIARGPRGLLQPAVKCRGVEYLRIIYGPEYTAPANLDRLRSRGLAAKRSLALREFSLGLESLERFARKEPLRRVHECVFGVLALESEPVDPRL